jgi:transposase
MSLHSHAIYPVPEATQRIARAAFPHGNIDMQVADRLGNLSHDAQFTALFPTRGQPAEAPARLALATVLQFAEGWSDRQAADAVRSRIDWQYVLGLELTDPGFHHTVLSEFRPRLVTGQAEPLRLDTLLTLARTQGLLKARGCQRTDSTHVVAAIRVLNRLERVGETLRAALNSLASVVPGWLQALAPLEGYDRYRRRVENAHLPKTEEARKALAAVIGADGQRLLRAMAAAAEQPWLQEVPAGNTLQRVWAEQAIEVSGRLSWREVKDMPSPADLIASPSDPEARYRTKREVEWVGYKVHLTETCETDTPDLVVNVETTPATTPDDHMLTRVHASLDPRDLLPAEHFVDTGYTDSQVLVESQQTYGVTRIGPVADDPSWQARTGTGFDKAQFLVDGERQVVTCPMGKRSIAWLPHTYPKNGMTWEVRFARKDCTPCPRRAQCTRAKQEPRIRGLQAREPYEALQEARPWQTTEEFRQQYAPRAGIESTHAQGIRRCGLRQARYRGLAKPHCQHLATAAALNVVRLGEWLTGTPRAKTRGSPFAALKAA